MDGALGALLLYVTNVLAIIVVGIVVFSAVRIARGELRDAEFKARRVLAAVAAGGSVVVIALTVLTVRTVQLSSRLSAATDVASDWADDHGERVVDARFDGTTLVLLVEGTSDGSEDRDLLGLLDGAVPAGTDVVVNRVPGRRSDVGAVR